MIVPSDFDETKRKIYIYPQNDVTIKLNVAEINKVITGLGAAKLLPASVDGKPITLKFGVTADINVELGQNGVNSFYSLSQQTAPKLIVDPAIPIADALGAMIDNPLLPVGIKEKLAGALENGTVPLPVISGGETEKYTENDTQRCC